MRTASTATALVGLLAASPSLATAAEGDDTCTRPRLLFVLDRSSSMVHEIGPETKWQIAADALGEVTTAYEDRIEIGLDVFPAAGECSPGTVVVEPALATATAISAQLASPPPATGNYTPMAQTLDRVLSEPALSGTDSAHVVLITDGWQWCYPYDPATRFAPVESVRQLQQAGVTTYIVGFGDGVDAAALNQMAVAAGTQRMGCNPDGQAPDSPNPCYYQADSPNELLAALQVVAAEIGDEKCNGIDDNCDGQTDEGLTQQCEGLCGMSVCESGVWSECGAMSPSGEMCNSMDDDCDGEVDEDEGSGLCPAGQSCKFGTCVDDDIPADDPEDAPGTGLSGGGCSAAGSAGGFAALLLLVLLGLVRWRPARYLCVLVAIGGGARAAQAQSEFSVERFRPASDGDGVLDVEWAAVPKHLDFDVSLWFGAADDPLITYQDDQDRERIGSVVDHRLGANLVASLALWERVQLGADLPLVLDQSAGDAAGNPEETKYSLGNVRLIPKLKIAGDQSAALAVIVGATFPTAQGGGEFTGETDPVLTPELAFSGRRGQTRIGANLGYRLRNRVENSNLVVDDEILARVGAAYETDSSTPIEVSTSLTMATAASAPMARANANYVELLGGLAFGVGGGAEVFTGAGVGLAQGFGAPDWRALAGLRFARRQKDPEPFRPEPLLITAALPREEKKEEQPKAVLRDDHIEILESVYFETDKDIIRRESYALLDAVAEIIVEHPELLVIRVEGHTDSRASHTYNQDLSQRRAESVARYLAGAGVDEERMRPVGYSETRPVFSNRTSDGRAANRRVEFNILEREVAVGVAEVRTRARPQRISRAGNGERPADDE